MRSFIFTLLRWLIPAAALAAAVVSPGIDGYERARLGEMVTGQAYKPYVYRTLAPSAIRLIKSVVPRPLRITLNDAAQRIPAVSQLFQQLRWDPYYLIEYILALIVLYFSLYGFQEALKVLLNSIARVPGTFSESIALAAIALLPLTYRYYVYIYDFPLLLLFTLALALMARRDWPIYMLVFILSCFNKETTVLLIMVFGLYFWRELWTLPRALLARLRQHSLPEPIWWQGWKLVAAQCIFFLLSRLIITTIYRDNPGGALEFHLVDYNLILFRKLEVWKLLAYGLPLIFLVFYQWKGKPLLLRRAVWILLPLVGLTVFFGFLDEWRDYYEAYPILALMAAHTIAALAQRFQRPGAGWWQSYDYQTWINRIDRIK